MRLIARLHYLTISKPPYIAEVLPMGHMLILGVHAERQFEAPGIGNTDAGTERVQVVFPSCQSQWDDGIDGLASVLCMDGNTFHPDGIIQSFFIQYHRYVVLLSGFNAGIQPLVGLYLHNYHADTLLQSVIYDNWIKLAVK